MGDIATPVDRTQLCDFMIGQHGEASQWDVRLSQPAGEKGDQVLGHPLDGPGGPQRGAEIEGQIQILVVGLQDQSELEQGALGIMWHGSGLHPVEPWTAGEGDFGYEGHLSQRR
ncbi:hypothetical protein I551_2003 [Mycobacterium ulcerans str. Harvey]|uniref:Uncharacterized protein n=1 Tax=Mycobacterium ulcerans str. Harvey TaxID=1299332 RepID=A0ABP3AP44_MYCUL|nr:hypothetical protein I551_2003 [Mycobacterium ulcerans str. Harvey]